MSHRPERRKSRTGARTKPAAASHAVADDPAHQKRIIDALYRVNSLMAEITDLKQLLNLIMLESKNVVGAEASSLILYDEEKDELYFEIALGEKGEQVKVVRLKMGEGIAGLCAQERRALVVNDVTRDDRHSRKADERSDFQTRNILATPMVRKDRLIGVLEVLNKFDNQPFTETDIKVMDFFADHAAIAVENAMLVEANVRAERLAALGQAVASISHYAKNVLMGISGGSSLIDRGLSTNDFDTVRKAWPVLQRSYAKITSLVQDMLFYSKERRPDLEKTNLNRLAKDVCEMVAAKAAESGVAVEAQLAPEMPDSMFDASRLHDAVLNIVSNAVDAARGQTQARVVVTTAYDSARRRIVITVEDNGPGIPQAIQKKIFEPFFSTKGSKGTGLGLALTQKVVREHGGEIALESSESEGTRFTIWLPYIEPSKRAR